MCLHGREIAGTISNHVYILCSCLILRVGTLLFVSVGLVSPTAFPFRSQKSIGFSTLEVPFKALLQVAK